MALDLRFVTAHGWPWRAARRVAGGLLAMGLAGAASTAWAQEPAAAPSPSPDTGTEAPLQAGGEVPVPKRKHLALPAYPEAAKARGVRGIVLIELVVEHDGRVGETRVVRSIPELDQAALEAVRQWTYEPVRLDGRPVRVRLTVPITFSMKLPEVTREAGIPELRQGVSPAFPSDSSGGAHVDAEVTLDPGGHVTDVLITKGEGPWAEAVLRALGTWAFALPEAEKGLLSFRVSVDFVRGHKGEAERVALALADLRRREFSPVGETPAADTSATGTPDAAPATRPASPEGVTRAPATPVTEVLSVPAPSSAPAAPTAPASTGESRPDQPGVSSVRDVSLGQGLPDLVQGRRPVVPPLARMAAVTGSVTVAFSVGAAGTTTVQDTAGPDLLKTAAQQMVQSWVFRRTSTERLRLVATIEYGTDVAKAAVAAAPATP